MGLAVGVTDPAELPGFLVVLYGIVLMTVLLMTVFFAFTPAAYILDAQGFKITRRLVRPVFVPYAQVKNVTTLRFAGPPFAIVRLGSHPPWGAFRLLRPVQGGAPGVDQGLRHVLGWRDGGAGNGSGTVLFSPAEPQKFCEALRLSGAARRVRGWGPQLKTAGVGRC
ncbi:hypothetical protein Desku_3220 [Desulfofundulus kuznetsovii DSM 6115]|uniref:PH domain-containing protein n=1 Tax=Desulfofundulus kuznetsovii (strain DSM 6115 / VKM B-1805 / 17) TaxID=760568 RepID=A0AAU8PFC6_DESK7|nr:hypothetical protein Desku_3220 [Desulfofundulus kuznetsovii DSM 6115]